VPPSPEYLGLVTRYASGEHDASVAALWSWDDDRLRCDLDNLQAAAMAARRCVDCEDRLVFQRFSLRAAILLHADREIEEQFASPLSEQPATCGTGKQAFVVERLAGMLILVDPEARAFLRRFYVAIARHAQWSHCFPQAERWARTGLKRLPKDGSLLLTLGIGLETSAFLTSVPAPRTAPLGPQALRLFESQTAKLGGLWGTVRRTFEEAIAIDPKLHEARLRLGRVFWRLRRPELARACFEEVLAANSEPALDFLAHLFLGRVHEDTGRIADAEVEYRAALWLRPLSDPAAVALSHARLLQGDPGSAREVLGSVIEQLHRRTEVDPYKNYLMAHTREGRTDLAQLRGEAAR
jgi:tetratricopeptide (TPR) repeat protein